MGIGSEAARRHSISTIVIVLDEMRFSIIAFSSLLVYVYDRSLQYGNNNN